MAVFFAKQSKGSTARKGFYPKGAASGKGIQDDGVIKAAARARKCAKQGLAHTVGRWTRIATLGCTELSPLKLSCDNAHITPFFTSSFADVLLSHSNSVSRFFLPPSVGRHAQVPRPELCVQVQQALNRMP